MSIIARLVDSEEHACEAAVPDVAYDAVSVIERLRDLCERALLALDEDYFPQLREELRQALAEVDHA